MIADPVQKDAWKKKLRLKHLVFNRIIKHFMLAEKKAAKTRAMEGKYLLHGCFKQLPAGEGRKNTGSNRSGKQTVQVLKEHVPY